MPLKGSKMSRGADLPTLGLFDATVKGVRVITPPTRKFGPDKVTWTNAMPSGLQFN